MSPDARAQPSRAAPRLTRKPTQLGQHRLATGVASCSQSTARRAVLGTARCERREDSDSRPARGLGRGVTASRSRPPTFPPIASGLATFGFTSFKISSSRSGCPKASLRSWAPWPEFARLALSKLLTRRKARVERRVARRSRRSGRSRQHGRAGRARWGARKRGAMRRAKRRVSRRGGCGDPRVG